MAFFHSVYAWLPPYPSNTRHYDVPKSNYNNMTNEKNIPLGKRFYVYNSELW